MFQPKTVNRIVSLLVVSLAASCAVENHERRKLLNYLDANWAPSSTSGRWLASPIALPVGVLAGATDAVVLHPISQIDDAWVDTVDVVWDFGASTDFRTVLLTPLSAVAAPGVVGHVHRRHVPRLRHRGDQQEGCQDHIHPGVGGIDAYIPLSLVQS